MEEWRALQLTIQSAVLGLGSIAGITILTWHYPEFSPLKYPIMGCVLLIALGVAVALRKPAPAIGLRRREEMVVLIAHTAMLVFGFLFLLGLGLLTVAAPWMWAAILLCLLVLFYALAISLLARGVLAGRHVFYQTHCTRCLYDVSSVESPTCPECGRAITSLQTEAS